MHINTALRSFFVFWIPVLLIAATTTPTVFAATKNKQFGLSANNNTSAATWNRAVNDVIQIPAGDIQPVSAIPLYKSTMYSDAETGIDGWVVYDNIPSGASVTSVFDAFHGSRVIQTDGDATNNRYFLGGRTAATGWDNRTLHTLSWDMSTEEPYILVVYLDTENGTRQLTYTDKDSEPVENPENNALFYELDSVLVGNGWRSMSRDLAADIELAEPGNKVLSVNGLLVAGSLRLDNISLEGFGGVNVDLSPTAVIEASTQTGAAPLTVSFNAEGSVAVAPAKIAFYAWNFGNGDTSVLPSAITSFKSAGSYSVSLTVTDNLGFSATAVTNIEVQGDKPPGTDSEAAARLLAQATFGATLDDIAKVERLGIEGWVDDQFTRQSQSHLEYVQSYPRTNGLKGPRQFIWMMDAIERDDQLRQRVAFAYSQVFVASDVAANLGRIQHSITNYYDILRRNAFGNYREPISRDYLEPGNGYLLE